MTSANDLPRLAALADEYAMVNGPDSPTSRMYAAKRMEAEQRAREAAEADTVAMEERANAAGDGDLPDASAAGGEEERVEAWL